MSESPSVLTHRSIEPARLGRIAAIALLIAAPSRPVNAQVLAPGDLLDGVSQKEWAARWFQWALPIKVGSGPHLALTSPNPAVETTGAQGWKGNFTGSQKVFFLAGVFGGIAGTETVNRTVTVGLGKSLFFPILNNSADNTVPITSPLSAPTSFTPDGMLTGDFGVDIIQSFDAASVFATIDGTPVANLNTFRQTFGGAGFNVVYTGPDSIATAFGNDATLGSGSFPSTVLTAEDGYWLAVQPLSLGTHTLNFGGNLSYLDPGGTPLGFGFGQNTTYTVNVVSGAPEPGSFALAAVGVLPLLSLSLITHRRLMALLAAACGPVVCAVLPLTARGGGGEEEALDQRLTATLRQAGLTGRIESQLERRLGRRINPRLAEVGRLLWFDTITGLNNDNTCAGCHSPTHGFGDTQSIAIGIDNNGIVGPHRIGPRNQRRTPMAINTAFFPALMWNSRFAALSGDPFDNHAGFLFPSPEGLSLSCLSHLLMAQAFIPPTERVEVAGFAFPGDPSDPAQDHALIRAEVLRRLNATPDYRRRFGEVFPAVRRGIPITFEMFGQAIAEFEFTLVFADAPIDRYARGERGALTREEKQGALLFFGRAGCVRCHGVSGASNEMFSDFRQHVAGAPQVAPRVSNVLFDGPGANEDFGREQVTSEPSDRYGFRTSPLRNVALQPAFFHNGAFTRLEDAIHYHLDAAGSAHNYTPAGAGLAADLSASPGPIDPVLAHLDPLLAAPVRLDASEFKQLVAFVRDGLIDPRARPERLRKLIPAALPSGRRTLLFE